MKGMRVTLSWLHARTRPSVGAVIARLVLAQALSNIERKESHVAGGLFDDLAANDGAVLVGDEFRDFDDLSARETFGLGWGFWLHNSSFHWLQIRGVSCCFHDSPVFLCAKAEDADD